MAACACCFTGAKADELTVADGTETSAYLPICGNYCDTEGTLGQLIYPASELADMAGTDITKVTFYSDAVPAKVAGCELQVSLKEVDNTEFEYSYDIWGYVTVEDMTVCGTHTLVEGETGFSCEFDTPFSYSGDKNLAVEVKVIKKASWTSFNFYGEKRSGYVSYYKTNSTSAEKFLAKATFEYSGEVLDYAAKVNPTSLDFGKVLVGNSADLSVTVKNTGANAFTPALEGLEAPFSSAWDAAEIAAGESVEIPVTYAPTDEGEFTGTLTVNCGEAGTFEVALSGTAKIPGNEVVVCEGTDKSAYAPVYGLYYDTQNSQVQFIYPAEKLAELKGRQITSVTFFPENTVAVKGGKLQLSVKETEQSVFERDYSYGKPDNIVTDLTAVATITPNADDTELVFEFDEPFVYNGGNLVFETLVTEKGTYATTSFYGENQSTKCAFYYYGSDYNDGMISFLPKAQFESKAVEEPETEFAINFTAEQENGTVEVTLADGTPVDADTKVAAGETVTVKATAASGYVITAFEVLAGDEPLELDAEDNGTDANGAPRRATGPKEETHTFVMPAQEVSVNVTFEVKTAVENINVNNAKSVRYVNLQGVESAVPFDGVNIVVTEMNDGSKVVTKAVK